MNAVISVVDELDALNDAVRALDMAEIASDGWMACEATCDRRSN